MTLRREVACHDRSHWPTSIAIYVATTALTFAFLRAIAWAVTP